MKLESSGILISLRPFDEANAIAQIFSADFGIMSGMLRGALSPRRSARPLIGQIGNFSWNARLDSALGILHWEPERNLAAPLMQNAQSLAFMNSAFDLISNLLPEREQYKNLYHDTVKLLNELASHEKSTEKYLTWEIGFIRDLGYALDLTHCSGCGRLDNLAYLSPRTGRAVCTDCGAPYADKLYRLPITLDTTFRFLENICLNQGAKTPPFRTILKGKFF